jgi:hypothetical protein
MTSALNPQDCVASFVKRLTPLDPEKSAYDKFRLRASGRWRTY